MSKVKLIGDGASIGFAEAVRRGLGRSTIYGRASRSEYWFFWLFCGLTNIVSLIIFAGVFNVPLLNQAVATLLSIFQTVVFVRRLHDVNRSGWWVLLAFTVIGIIPLLVWALRKGSAHRNRFDIGPQKPQRAPLEATLTIDRIEKLAALRSSGAINEDEYQTLKNAAL